MEKIDLTNVDTAQLQYELSKRENEKSLKLQIQENKKKLENWRNRPRADIIGKAYGFSELETQRLASVYIEGNSGTYNCDVKTIHSVRMYFHNVWTDKHRRDFETSLRVITEYYISKIANDVNIVASLICLTHVDKEIEKEFHEAAIERLCEFSLEVLIEGNKKVKDWHNSGHGQDSLLIEALAKKKEILGLIGESIKVKKEKNIPDRPKVKLSDDMKTKIAIGILKVKK